MIPIIITKVCKHCKKVTLIIVYIYVYESHCIDVSIVHGDHKQKLTWTNILSGTIRDSINNLINLQVLNIKNNDLHSHDIVPLLCNLFDNKYNLISISKANNLRIKHHCSKFATDYGFNYTCSNYKHTIRNDIVNVRIHVNDRNNYNHYNDYCFTILQDILKGSYNQDKVTMNFLNLGKILAILVTFWYSFTRFMFFSSNNIKI